MLTRLVKMSFPAANAAEFIRLFENAKPVIESMQGNTGVRLLSDALPVSEMNRLEKNTGSVIFFTHSTWHLEADLEAYRQSKFFRATWAKTKQLFDAKPEAWSVYDVDNSLLK